MKMVELYWVATNREFDLDVRYAAVRQMQERRRPERPRRTRRPLEPEIGMEEANKRLTQMDQNSPPRPPMAFRAYSKTAEKMILNCKQTRLVADALERSCTAIYTKRHLLRKALRAK